ncbi:MAG: hypothetical protein ACJ8G3_12820 [Burkholderiaceae bacterium]
MNNSLNSQPESKVAQTAQGAYDPGLFLDHLISRLELSGDAQLARVLHMDKRLLVRIRARQQPITGSMLMDMQEATGLTVDKLRTMLNDRRKTSRMVGWPASADCMNASRSLSLAGVAGPHSQD